MTDWAAAASNPGFEDGAVAMGSYWYALGCLYDTDNTVAAWSKDFPLTYGGKNEQNKEIWTLTINYDDAKATNDIDKGFKLRRYSSETAEEDLWNTQLGMWASDPNDFMNIEFDYNLADGTDGNKNIRFEEAGRYTLTLTGNNLVVAKIPAN